MNESSTEGGINIRSGGYSIARSETVCPHCRGITRVVGLLVPPGHRVRSTDDGTPPTQEPPCPDSWEPAARRALLFYVESLPDAARLRLQALAPMFGFAFSPVAQGSYWANHCERCGGTQEDHDLFCEPEGAFVPLDPASGSAIEVVAIDECLEVAAAGYTVDPDFIGPEPRA